MKKDFYEVLGLKRIATQEQVSNAFKRLGLKHHPMKNPSEMALHTDAFHRICEAYEVLSNQKLRAIYDQHGEEVLREGIKDCASGDFKGGYKYQGNCYQIFEAYFLQYNPFHQIIDTKGEHLHGSLFGNAFGGQNATKIAPMTPIFVEVPCNLQEFYNGCVKTIQYQRQRVALDGQNMEVETVNKQIQVKRGQANQMVLIFKGQGNEQRMGPPTDLIVTFVLYFPKSGPTADLLSKYKRQGNDLIYTHELSLEDALQTKPVRVETLDARILSVSLDEIVSSRSLRKVEGEGMPILKGKDEQANLRFGNLYIKFKIGFPKQLSED